LSPNIDTHPRKRIPIALPHQEDVSDLGGLGVRLGEEAGARAGRVERGELGAGDGADGVFVGF